MDNDTILITLPVFNDWNSLELLLLNIDEELYKNGLKARILAVDDCSTIQRSLKWDKTFKSINKIEILHLKRNLGHQRAIVIALAYIENNIPCQAVVVMDADGEDDPRDVIELIKNCKDEQYNNIIFAKRTKRSESYIFRFFYFLYKFTYRILTGQTIDIGNFSIVPYELLKKAVSISVKGFFSVNRSAYILINRTIMGIKTYRHGIKKSH